MTASFVYARRIALWLGLFSILLLGNAMAQRLNQETDLLIGFIRQLHGDQVQMDQLREMVDTQGAINPILERVAATGSGLSVYRQTFTEMLKARHAINWDVVRQHVEHMLHESARGVDRQRQDAAQTQRPWHQMNFIDLPPGQIPDPDNEGMPLTNSNYIKVMDSHVTESMFAEVMGRWPEGLPARQYQKSEPWWIDGKPGRPDAPTVKWSFLSWNNRGRVFLDRLNEQRKVRGWRYDVPTRDERRYLLAAAINELRQQYPALFWYTGNSDSVSPMLYGAYFNDDKNDTLCPIKSCLPLTIDQQPIWDLFGLVDDLVYHPQDQGMYSIGTRGGRTLFIPTTPAEAVENLRALRQSRWDKALPSFIAAEQQAHANPYQFWVNFLNKVHGNSDGWPMYQTGLRLVLRRVKGPHNYYKMIRR